VKKVCDGEVLAAVRRRLGEVLCRLKRILGSRLLKTEAFLDLTLSERFAFEHAARRIEGDSNLAAWLPVYRL
jgi:hypothetical protein